MIGNNRIGLNRIGLSNKATPKPKDYYIRNIFQPFYIGCYPLGSINDKVIFFGTDEDLINKYNTLLELHGKDGALIKSWYYNQDNDNPISNINFELTEKGSGAGNIEFCYLDFPIESEYFFYIMLQGQYLYSGFVTNDIEVSSPKVELLPFQQRLKECFYSTTGEFNGTIFDLLKDVVNDTTSFTGITWDDSLVDIGVADNYIGTIDREYAWNVIEMLVSKLTNRYWGVNIDRKFYVTADKLTDIDQTFYQNDSCIFSDMKVTADYSNIEATRYEVYKKVDSTAVYVGSVPDGTVTFPYLSIEDKLRIIWGRYEASEKLSDPSALEIAYAELVQKAKIKQTIEVKNVNAYEYIASIGDRIMVEDKPQYSLLLLNDCAQTTGWTNVSIEAGAGLNNENCLKLFVGDTFSHLDFGAVKTWYKQKKIGLYIKSSVTDKTILLKFSNDLVTFTTYKILCRSTAWEYYDFSHLAGFRYIYFDKNGNSNNFFVENIFNLCLNKKQYTDNVSLIKFKLSKDVGIEQNLTLGDITEEESDELRRLRRKVEILEKISQI